MDFTISWDTIIGVLALLVAIGSYIYTWRFNHYAIDLINLKVDQICEHNNISFEIVNISTKPIKITDITLFDNAGKKIVDNGFSPKQFRKYQNSLNAKKWEMEHAKDFIPGLNPYTSPINNMNLSNSLNNDESCPFDESTYLKSDDSEYFSYFVDTFPSTIKVTAKQHINYFSKFKSFSTIFNKSN
jgi:hypothetical protein